MEIEAQMQADRVEEAERKRADDERTALVLGAKKTLALAKGKGNAAVVRRMGSNGVVKKPGMAARRRLGGF